MLKEEELHSNRMSLRIELAAGTFDATLQGRLEFHLGAAGNLCGTLSDGMGNEAFADLPEISYDEAECTAGVTPFMVARAPARNVYLDALTSFHQRHAAIARVSLEL